jgi:SAM-dependent methyltransferase
MTLEKGWYLDIGGGCYYKEVDESLFSYRAVVDPNGFYVIADTVNPLYTHLSTPNLLYTQVGFRRNRLFPFDRLARYSLPFADNSFNNIRLDMVIDWLSKTTAIKVIREAARVLKPGAMLNIVDIWRNEKKTVGVCDTVGFDVVTIYDGEQVMNGNYLLSPESLRLLGEGYRLFRLEAQKSDQALNLVK